VACPARVYPIVAEEMASRGPGTDRRLVGPWFFGFNMACYARRQNSRKVVSGNEPATGCRCLYQRADARRSPNGFCNVGVYR